MTDRWRSARATARLLGRVPVLARLAVLVSGAVALAATVAPAWDVPDGYLYLAGLALVVAAVVPDAGGGFGFAAAITVGWAVGADTYHVGPAVVVTALALLVGHVAGALAASLPATADAEPALLLRWWRPTAVLAAGTVAAAALVAVLDARDPGGSIVLVVAALVVAAAGVWWWSSPGGEA